jgi:CrcB protein
VGLRELALVALGGGLGSAARYAVTGLAQRAAGATAWPVGTLTVNLSGSLLIGLFAGLALGRSPPAEGLRLLLVTGVLGGYTTFSAFSLENLCCFARARWPWRPATRRCRWCWDSWPPPPASRWRGPSPPPESVQPPRAARSRAACSASRPASAKPRPWARSGSPA